MTKGPENRRHPRYSCYAKATLSDGWLGYLRNISKCGARLSVIRSKPFAAGESLEVQMRPSDSEEDDLSIHAVVVWCQSFGPYCDIGVSFKDIAPEETEKINRFADVLAERRREDVEDGNVEVEIHGESSSAGAAPPETDS